MGGNAVVAAMLDVDRQPDDVPLLGVERGLLKKSVKTLVGLEVLGALGITP